MLFIDQTKDPNFFQEYKDRTRELDFIGRQVPNLKRIAVSEEFFLKDTETVRKILDLFDSWPEQLFVIADAPKDLLGDHQQLHPRYQTHNLKYDKRKPLPLVWHQEKANITRYENGVISIDEYKDRHGLQYEEKYACLEAASQEMVQALHSRKIGLFEIRPVWVAGDWVLY